MKLDTEQRAIVQASVLAIATTIAALVAAYFWLPPSLFGMDGGMTAGDRIAFALQADLLVLLWLAGCVRAVSRGRFRLPNDRPGSAYSPPSPALAVRVAVLQNSLEQTVLAVGAHLALATVLEPAELVLMPVLVVLYLIGRVAFAAGYTKGAAARAYGMALTGASTLVALLMAASLLVAGR